MKDIQKIITEKFGIDRLLHFACGGWLACLGSTWYYAILIGVFIGFSKEIADKYIKKSIFDYGDLLATILGALITALVKFLFVY